MKIWKKIILILLRILLQYIYDTKVTVYSHFCTQRSLQLSFFILQYFKVYIINVTVIIQLNYSQIQQYKYVLGILTLYSIKNIVLFSNVRTYEVLYLCLAVHCCIHFLCLYFYSDSIIQKTKQKYNNSRTLYTKIDLSGVSEVLKNNPPYEVNERELGTPGYVSNGTTAHTSSAKNIFTSISPTSSSSTPGMFYKFLHIKQRKLWL